MKTYKQKAEQYVREKCPELMELSFGCEVDTVYYDYGSDSDYLARMTIAGTHNGLRNEYVCSYKGESGYVRSFGVGTDHFAITEIIGHPIQLQHWLRVLEEEGAWLDFLYNVGGFHVRRSYGMLKEPTAYVEFNLSTGQPATETDYQAFCEIVEI